MKLQRFLQEDTGVGGRNGHPRQSRWLDEHKLNTSGYSKKGSLN